MDALLKTLSLTFSFAVLGLVWWVAFTFILEKT